MPSRWYQSTPPSTVSTATSPQDRILLRFFSWREVERWRRQWQVPPARRFQLLATYNFQTPWDHVLFEPELPGVCQQVRIVNYDRQPLEQSSSWTLCRLKLRPSVPEEVVWWNIRLNQMVRKRYRCGRSAAKPNGAWTWEVLASTEWVNGSMVRQVWNQPTLEPSISAPRKWLDEHWPTQGLKGKGKDGEFRTAQAKEYPSALCRSLIVAILKGLRYRLHNEGSRAPFSPSKELVQWLYHMHEQSEVLALRSYLPDYQGAWGIIQILPARARLLYAVEWKKWYGYIYIYIYIYPYGKYTWSVEKTVTKLKLFWYSNINKRIE